MLRSLEEKLLKDERSGLGSEGVEGLGASEGFGSSEGSSGVVDGTLDSVDGSVEGSVVGSSEVLGVVSPEK